MLGRIGIRQDLIDFPHFQGCRILCIRDTDGEARLGCCQLCHRLIQKSLNLVLLRANSGCLVPVEFSWACRSIGKQYRGAAFPFPPPTPSIPFPQARNLANTTVDRNRLDLGDVADDSKAHTPSTFQRTTIRDTDSVSRHHCTTSAAADANGRWAAGQRSSMTMSWTANGDRH